MVRSLTQNTKNGRWLEALVLKGKGTISKSRNVPSTVFDMRLHHQLIYLDAHKVDTYVHIESSSNYHIQESDKIAITITVQSSNKNFFSLHVYYLLKISRVFMVPYIPT